MSENTNRKIPQEKTKSKWQSAYPWLGFSADGMKCTLCCEWKKKIENSKNFSDRFVVGCNNYRISAVQDHGKSEMHLKSIEENDKKNAEDAGETFRKRVVTSIPENSPLLNSLKKASAKERESLIKLFDVAYLIAMKGRPYTDYPDYIELEKIHGVKFDVNYNHRNACAEFIRYISQSLFDVKVKEKLKRVNFITVLCDGATDAAIIEKECIFVLFVDPDTFLPTMTFFELKDVPSQDAPGIETAIREAFVENGLPHLLDRMVFFASDGTNVNSGLKSGLITVFQEKGLDWLAFVWCLSHRLELALKDSLSDAMSDIHEVLTSLFYLYKKSSKKLRELRQLHTVLKDVYTLENDQVRPSKASGTRWIAHIMRSMAGFVDKYGVYVQHLENIIADTSKQTDKAKLEGKRRKMINASVLLRSCLFLDLLDSAKNFSLATQYEDSDIVNMVDRIDDMKLTYQLFYRKFKKSPKSVFELPTLKKFLNNIKIEDDNKVTYQGIKLLNFEQAKKSIENKALSYVENILTCLSIRFGELIGDDETEVDERSLMGDKLLHDVCALVDTRNWVLPEDTAANLDNVQLHLQKIFESAYRIYDRYEPLLRKVQPEITKDQIEKELAQVMIHTINVLSNQTIPPKQIWQLLFRNDATKNLHNIFLIAEICLCAPYSNACIERFFSQMRVVKTDWRNRLNEKNLSSLLYVKTEGPTLQIFHDVFCPSAVDLWYSDKTRRLNQGKRKKYKKRKDAKPKYQKLDFNLPSIFDLDSENSSSESENEQ